MDQFSETFILRNISSIYLAGRLTSVKIAFDTDGIGLVQNIYDLRDALTVMHVKRTLQYGKMETQENECEQPEVGMYNEKNRPRKETCLSVQDNMMLDFSLIVD